jgi:hypothetical protein
MKLLVTFGSVDYDGKSYKKGVSFDAPKDISEFLLNAKVVEAIEEEVVEAIVAPKAKRTRKVK